jgi:hypothetical protein
MPYPGLTVLIDFFLRNKFLWVAAESGLERLTLEGERLSDLFRVPGQESLKHDLRTLV